MKSLLEQIVKTVDNIGPWAKRSRSGEGIKVRYKFQKLSPQQVSPIETFGRDVEWLLRHIPTAIPDLPFGVSSHVCSGMLEAMPEGAPDYSALRLESLDADGHTLLRNIWGPGGELDRVVYYDGQIASYKYDREQRLSNVKFSDTSEISYEYASDGSLAKTHFGKTPTASFAYERSNEGILVVIHYPHGSVRFGRDAAGMLTCCETDIGKIEYAHQPDPKISRVRLISGEATLNFQVVSGNSEAVWAKNTTDGTSILLSPMGIHRMNDKRRVQAWVRWDGQYMKLFHHADGMIRRIWSVKGSTTLEYAKDGKVASLYRPDGRRYYCHREQGKPFAILVGPGGAILLRYDSSGRPVSIMDSWGSYVSLEYGRVFRSTLPIKVKSQLWGCVDIKYGKMNRISSVTVTGNGYVTLEYDSKGKLSGISWRCPNYAAASQLLHLVGWLWTLMSAGENVYLGGFEWSYWVL
jgi:hypothetical protein